MTSPNVDLDGIMPYGVTVEGDGVNRTAIPIGTSDIILSGGYVRLPAGPCRVAVSWSGSESVRAVLPGVGYPVTLEAGGGSAPGAPLSARKMGTKSCSKTPTQIRSPRAHEAQSRCTHSHSSNPGGGQA